MGTLDSRAPRPVFAPTPARRTAFPRIPALLVLLALAALAGPAPAASQGWIEPDRPGRPGFGVERLRTHVQVRVEGRVAHVEVEEWFRNTGGAMAEGVYVYPLPGESVFRNTSLYQGDQELTGETLDAEEARRIYEEIVRRRRDPALIELVGQGLIRARVFPFGPGETRKVTLRFTQLLGSAGDALELRYVAGRAARSTGPGPLITPRPPRPGRPTPQPAAGEPARSSVPSADDGAPLTFTVTVEDGERFLDPFSPTHRVRVERAEGRIVVRPEGPVSGRFVLLLPPAGEAVRLSLASYRPSGEDGYFMLTLSPGAVEASAMPRDLVAVIDVSGSMSGEKIEQTRRALVQLLGSLGPSDRFRLIRFSSGVESYRPGWTPARPAAIRDAQGWARSLEANGGTNIAGALEEAFRERTPEGRLPVVVFLTDGLPTVGERNPEAIARSADSMRDRARVFAFGVGYDVDTWLLDRLTIAGGGSVEYVEPGEDVERALGMLSTRIRHPVLADLELERMPGRIREVFPTELPDLFAGEELTIFGRYARPAEGDVSIRGRREGRTERFRTRVSLPEHAVEHEYIARLWAARKIGELSRQVRLHGPDPELVDEIRETGLRYGILTEYTSHLVLEPGMVAGLPREDLALPQVAPTSGAGAVARAEASSAQRRVTRAGDVAELHREAEERLRAAAPDAASDRIRVVAGRAFVERDGEWTDRLHVEDAPTIEVEAFSAAYFALLRALPELRAWLSEMDAVVVAGREVSLRVGSGGRAELAPAEIARIVREFRGA